MNFFHEIREKLISLQLESESPVFQVINEKRLKISDKDLRKLGLDEYKYFWFYADSFFMQILSFFPIMPLSFYSYNFMKEKKKPLYDILKMKKYFTRMMIIAIPAFNIYVYTIYRQYFYLHPSLERLQKRYSDELKKNLKTKIQK